jgi:hypothetical protein
VTKAANGKYFLQYSHTFLNDSLKFFSTNSSVITHGHDGNLNLTLASTNYMFTVHSLQRPNNYFAMWGGAQSWWKYGQLFPFFLQQTLKKKEL